MIKKRKVELVITLLSVALLLLLFILCFSIERKNEIEIFLDSSCNFADTFVSENNYDNYSELIEELNCSNCYYRNAAYPKCTAIFDENGNYITSSKFTLMLDDKLYDIDEYFDNDTRQKYEELMSEGEGETDHSISITYCFENDKLIPVSIFVYTYGEKNPEEIKLTDHEPTHRASDNYNDGSAYIYAPLNIYGRHIEDAKSFLYDFSKYTSEKKLSVEEFCDEFNDEFNNEVGNDFHNSLYLVDTKINGKSCTIAMASVINPNDIVFFYSNTFAYNIDNIALIVLVIWFSAIIAAEIIITKKNKLEAAKYAFTNAAAHELKTPVAVIENQCECILENVNPEKNGEYINNVYKQSIRMAKLLQNLLEYNKLNMNNKIAMSDSNLSDIVNEQIDIYSTDAQIKNISISSDIENGLYCKCNVELIALVIDNFISNAVKYGNTDSEIKVTLNKKGRRIRFSVFNIGEQIKDKNIWSLLYMNDKSRCGDSTGMGLAVSSKILDIHKFRYGYINKKDGVEFYFITR